MNTLRNAFERLKRLPFPDHPSSDELDDWLLDLTETDGYLAGLAQTVLAGGNMELGEVKGLVETERSLQNISVNDETDGEIYRECQEYLLVLKSLYDALAEQGRAG